jgi:hypothetical protein
MGMGDEKVKTTNEVAQRDTRPAMSSVRGEGEERKDSDCCSVF